MQRKDLALRVLSTAAIMSIVTSIAAPAFAGTYYMANGNLSIRQDEHGKVYVKSGDTEEQEDKDGEVIICGGAGDNKWSNAPSGGAAAATGTEGSIAGEGGSAAGNNAEGGSAPTAAAGTEGSVAGESQPDPDAAFTLSEAEEDSAQTQEGKDTTENPTENPTANPTEDTPKPSTENPTENHKKDVVYEYDPAADPEQEQQATKLAPTSADPEEKTLKTTLADTPTASPAAAEEPSTKLEDVTVDTAYKPAAPTSAASSNWISVVNNCLNKVLNIRLRDVNIKKTTGDDTAPMTVDGKGNTTIELDGNNVLDAFNTSRRTYAAGLEKKGTGTLTITDTDSITAADGTQDNKLRGSLTAAGGWESGAGIGSRSIYSAGPHDQTENITIAGNAYVNAQGIANASGIGGGQGGNAKNITIKDNAYVVAEGGTAGIGSGTYGGSSDVKIQGGTVVAEGFYTGIGGHYRDSDTSGATETSTIEISGGTVYANENRNDNKGVSIGSTGGNSKITISGDAKVKNTGMIGSYASYDVKDEGISSTIIIKDNAMIADDSGAIGGNTSTNITIQDNAVIGDPSNFNSRPNEWFGYIGTAARSNEAGKNIKATIQIKDNALIKKVKFIGGKYAAADIKIQDNAHIKKIDTDDDPYSISAIGSNYQRAEITIGGSSDPNKPQQGTVRIDEARNGKPYTVIGSASGGGTVSIKGNVQLSLVKNDTFYDRGDYVKGDKVVTPEQLRDMIGADSKIFLKNEETNKLENIVHGKNVCAHVDGEVVEKVDATCTAEGHITYRCNYEKENGATGNSCDRIWTEKVPALGHDFTVKKSEMPATCERAGTIVWKCSRCNETKTETIPALDHLWKEDHRTGNCGVAGDIYYVCERDHSHTKTEHVEATGNHTWGEWTIVTEATCTSNGSKERECSVCHKKETETIPATGHHWVDKGDGTHTCPDCGATEGQPVNTNSALELRVVDAEGMDQPFTVSQNGTLRTYTGAYDTATLTGDLNTLRYLQDHGAQTIQFVTNGQTSSFDINDLLAQGSGSEVFYLTHRGAEEPTLLLVEADHSELVKD